MIYHKRIKIKGLEYMIQKQRAWAEVDLDAIRNNIREIRRYVDKKTKILGVVKADAYGHGVFEVSQTLIENGADALGVAFLDEAIQLRRYGIDKPILILGYTPPECAKELVQNDIMPSVFHEEVARAVSDEAVRQGKTAKIHIKIDTGMTRVGFRYHGDEQTRRQTADIICRVARLPNIEMDGIFTHFASADETDSTYTRHQFELFCDLVQRIEKAGVMIPTKHVCNSAGTVMFPEMHLDMVRPGIILYGISPSEEVDRTKLHLIPAMQLKAEITNLKEVEAGVSVSYGRTYHTARTTKIATIPIGYADGFSRLLSNRAEVSVHGQKVPVIGTICMDQCMVDVSSVNTVSVGDEIILFGSDGSLNIPVEHIASQMGTIPYEILCVIGKRIPRVYLHNGKVEQVLNYLLGDPITHAQL